MTTEATESPALLDQLIGGHQRQLGIVWEKGTGIVKFPQLP